MAQKSGVYRFTAPAEGSIERFMSRNRVSTDALNALIRWREARPGRDYEVLQDEDELLVVTLTFDDADHRAGLDLDGQAASCGVAFKFERPA